jgi:endonuclease G, mitochondrial
MLRIVLISLHLTCLLWATESYSQNNNQFFNQFKFSLSANCDYELSYSYYNLCYSMTHRQSLIAIHELNKAQIKGKQARTNDFRVDSRVSNPVEPNEYKRSGYDRGHLVPAADMKLNTTAMSETFYMTNMSPQDSSFNSGIWNALEGYVRNEVLKSGSAIVITAPVLLKTEIYSMTRSKISIPSYYYKIIYFYESGFMKAYLIPNEHSRGLKFHQFQVSVDEIEKLTDIDFFSELEDELENSLEFEIK